MHFVYVMRQEDKEKSDSDNNIWVFENPTVMTFDDEDRIANAGVSYILSDMLTF